MSGSGVNSNPGPVDGTYGTLGTPAAANTPGTRSGFATWTDNEGNLWLFGGNAGSGYMNDLWEYQPLAPAPVPSFALFVAPDDETPNGGPRFAAGTPSPTSKTSPRSACRSMRKRLLLMETDGHPVRRRRGSRENHGKITARRRPATSPRPRCRRSRPTRHRPPAGLQRARARLRPPRFSKTPPCPAVNWPR